MLWHSISDIVWTLFEGSPEEIFRNQVENNIADAFKLFKGCIKDIAEGSYDGYFNSFDPPKHKVYGDTKMDLLPTPILLLHGLSKYSDMNRINELFTDDTMFVVFEFSQQ
jgi:hypothetical protein